MKDHLQSSLLLLNIFLKDRATLKKMFWVLLSFSLSLAFILCNLGLMQGYETIFNKGLKETQGDISIISRSGFFKLTEDQEAVFNREPEIKNIRCITQAEVFLIYKDFSRATQVRTYSDDLMPQKTNAGLKQGEVIVGDALAKEWRISQGDEVALMFARGNVMGEYLPEVKTFKVVGVKKHKLYNRDSRTLYANYKDMAEMTNSGDMYNIIMVDLKQSEDKEFVSQYVKKLQKKFGPGFSVRPFWYEFSGLLEAVQVEKNIITLALQLIVLVAMFNMISFFRVLFETNYQALFLLRALGLSLKNIKFFLLLLSIILWFLANLGASLWSSVFSWLLKNWSFLSLPGKIYHLAEIELVIGSGELMTVSLLSLLWIVLLWFWFAKKLSNANLVSVLKGEWR